MTTLQILITVLASINLLMSLTILFRIKQPASPVLWIIKAVPTAVSPILAFVGLLIVISGVISIFTCDLVARQWWHTDLLHPYRSRNAFA